MPETDACPYVRLFPQLIHMYRGNVKRDFCERRMECLTAGEPTCMNMRTCASYSNLQPQHSIHCGCASCIVYPKGV